jgi:XTP/dITP diphosphohydrolase
VTRLVLASRNAGKLRELRALLPGEIRLVTPGEAGIVETEEEDGLERSETFTGNALAKARYFAARSGLPALADDSGLVVDALGGAPGVRSRRFAAPDERRGEAQDAANIRKLLTRLEGVPDPARTARFVCAAAMAWPDGRDLVRTGELEGLIVRVPSGSGGFGYDPVFLVPAENRTLADLDPARKNEISHRARAVGSLLDGAAGLGRRDRSG